MADLPRWIPGVILIVAVVALAPRAICWYVGWRLGRRG